METICEAEALTSQQAKGQRIRQAEIDVTGRSASKYENEKVVYRLTQFGKVHYNIVLDTNP